MLCVKFTLLPYTNTLRVLKFQVLHNEIIKLVWFSNKNKFSLIFKMSGSLHTLRTFLHWEHFQWPKISNNLKLNCPNTSEILYICNSKQQRHNIFSSYGTNYKPICHYSSILLKWTHSFMIYTIFADKKQIQGKSMGGD